MNENKLKELEQKYEISGKEFIDRITASNRHLKKIRKLFNDDLVYSNFLEIFNGQAIHVPSKSTWHRIRLYRIIDKAFRDLQPDSKEFVNKCKEIKDFLEIKYRFFSPQIEKMLKVGRYIPD